MINNFIHWIDGPFSETKEIVKNLSSGFESILKVNIYSSFDNVESFIYQEDCFSSNRLVIFKDIPDNKTNNSNKLKKITDNLPETCSIVFENLTGEGVKSLQNHVLKNKKSKNFYVEKLLTKENARFYVIDKFSQRGKAITEDIADKMVLINGFDAHEKGINADILYLLVEKISQYAGKRKNIEEKDILINSFPSDSFEEFSILEALDSKDPTYIYNQMNRFFEKGETGLVIANKFLTIGLWRYKMLLLIKEGNAFFADKQKTKEELLKFNKLSDKGNGHNIITYVDLNDNGETKRLYNDFFLSKSIFGAYNVKAYADLYTRKDLVRIIKSFYNAIEQIRSGHSFPMFLVDSIVLSICYDFSYENNLKISKCYE
jgi:hypothetical protein